MKKVLLHTLKVIPKEEATPELIDAWSKVYDHISDVMINGVPTI